MCGISGQISFNEPVNKELALKLSGTLSHRGPDDKGIYISKTKKCVLAHRRLSIIDPSVNGKQPMLSQDRQYIVVFNGEIYNYAKLRNGLIDHGVKFYSNSDTEVLLALYVKYGVDCLKYLRGMFAFAIWDEIKEELFLARDPLGIKPVFYSCLNNQIIFSSEVKSFKKTSLCSEIDLRSLKHFLQSGSIPSPKTIYKNIQSLEKGSWMRFSKDGFNGPNKYWNTANIYNNNLKLSNRNEAVDYLREVLLDSVKSHLVSDVPVGAFLSGGIDSSAVVSLMRQLGQSKIGTFSISFNKSEINESRFSRKISQIYDTDHHELLIDSENLISYKNNFILSLDQPTIDGLNTFIVSDWAKANNYKVVTSGIGGDELFRGYNLFRYLPFINNILKNTPELFKAFGVSILSPLIKSELLNNKWQRALNLLDSPHSFENLYEQSRTLFTNEEINDIIAEHQAPSDDETNKDYLEDIYNDQISLQKNLTLFEINRYLCSQLLYDSDVFSMANSIELRTPFVDKFVIEGVSNIKNDNWYYDKKYNKSLLVDSVGDLPSEIYNRRKMGFFLPMDYIIKNEKYKIKSDLINSEYYEAIEKLYFKGKINNSKIWALRVLDTYLVQ